jgi:hypothetical protein
MAEFDLGVTIEADSIRVSLGGREWELEPEVAVTYSVALSMAASSVLVRRGSTDDEIDDLHLRAYDAMVEFLEEQVEDAVEEAPPL